MKPTEIEIILLNNLIKEAVDHGGDAGGPYFCNKKCMIDAMTVYKNKVFGENAGIHISVNDSQYPCFIVEEVK